MKKSLIVASMCLLGATSAFAQWTQPGGAGTSPIYYNVANGKVGIGTTTPGGVQFYSLLHVLGAGGAGFGNTQFILEENTNPAGTGGFLAKANGNYTAEFGVRGSSRITYGCLVANDGYMYSNGSFTFMADEPSSGVLKFATGGSTERMRIDVNGNVGIGMVPSGPFKLEVAGDVNLTGTINAKYQDIAEWVSSSGDMTPGTVVIISDDVTNAVIPSAHAYDTHVAGVVSARPGLTLGVEGDSKTKIATTGRVKVRVDASKHAISRGDLLVTSDRPGVAMFSEPLDLGGTKIHRPGTLIGKALEPLPNGEGEILVLLSLQ